MTPLVVALVVATAPEEAQALCKQYGWSADLRERVEVLLARGRDLKDEGRRRRVVDQAEHLLRVLDEPGLQSPTTELHVMCESLATAAHELYFEALSQDDPPFFAKECTRPDKERAMFEMLARLELTARSKRDERALADLEQLRFELKWMRSYGECASVRSGLADVESRLQGDPGTPGRLCSRADWRAWVERRLLAKGGQGNEAVRVRKLAAGAVAVAECETAEKALLKMTGAR